MGLIISDINKHNAKLYLWEISESILELESMYLKSHEIRVIDETYNDIKLENRKKHWLISRLILFDFFKAKCEIAYDEFGAPHIENQDFNISISHSGNILTVLISRNRLIGIDIQLKSNKLAKIHTKFLSDKELTLWNKDNDTDLIHALWTIKEAVFKSFRHNLAFKDVSLVSGFPFKSNLIEVSIKRQGKTYVFPIIHDKIGEYYLSYVKL